MRPRPAAIFWLAAVVAPTISVASADELAPIADFTLREARGADFRLADWANQPVVVAVFLGTECPLAKLYAGKLQALADRYADRGVQLVGIVSNEQDSPSEMQHYARRHGIRFPLLTDPGAKVADSFAALRTPEAFVLDARRVVRYRGRIDDRYGVDYQRPRAEVELLQDAIEAALEGQAPPVAHSEAVGCLIGRVRPPTADAPVTWSNRVAAIFQEHCQDCHRPGQIGPFPLLSYEDTQGWGEMIREVVSQRRMPPWHANPEYGSFVNNVRLSAEEVAAIQAWVEHGCPQGDPAAAPPPREFPSQWQIPEPDQIVYMSAQPFAAPAEGTVEYQWFTVDPGFTEDKWIMALECRPGNPQVVHHVTVYFHPPGVDWNLKLNERINLLGGYTPGKRPATDVRWDGTARFVPAGSKLVFEMHYTTNGTPQTDRSCVALLFADPKQVQKQLSVVAVANTDFAIPPHAERYEVNARYTVDEDSLLYALSPHMHLRGSAFRFVARYPTGAAEVLLDVPCFEFNWQTDYRLTEAKPMPRGAVIECTGWFDNSAQNLSNPDPTATVRWGDQTWEEMMIGSIALAPAQQDLRRGIGPPPRVYGSRQRWWAVRVLGLAIAAAAGAALTVWSRRRGRADPISAVRSG